jgi:hypothetical protein
MIAEGRVPLARGSAAHEARNRRESEKALRRGRRECSRHTSRNDIGNEGGTQMKVSELIEMLEDCEPDADVFFYVSAELAF